MQSDLRLCLACIGLVFTLGNERATAASGPFAVALDGNILHIASGFSFPNKIGKFQRVMTRQYDAAGQGVSVGYEVDTPRIAATINVYQSSGRLLEQSLWFERMRSSRYTRIPSWWTEGRGSLAPKRYRH